MMRYLLAFLIGFALMWALSVSGWASSHAFSPQIVMAALTEKMRLTPLDKFSVETSQGSALVEYKGVVLMPGTDDYAIVINVRRW
jgi:hypothetical protein